MKSGFSDDVEIPQTLRLLSSGRGAVRSPTEAGLGEHPGPLTPTGTASGTAR
jgi:hypothetical protein